MSYLWIKVAGWLWSQRAAILAMLALLMWVTDMAKILVIAGFYSIFEMLSTIELDNLQEADLSTLEFIGVGNAIFPFAEMLALLVVYYTLWLNLIVFRWIKSFIPTLTN